MSRSVPVVEIGDGLLRTRGAGVDLAFRMRGSGPAVVLLHGTSANHAVWEPVGDALASRATVIALDQRGHGRSDKPASGYTGDDFVSDVVTVLDALGLERALVAGHSLGGRNAWLAAARQPGRVTGAVVVDYTPFVEPEVLDELDVRVAAGFRSFPDRAAIEQYLRERYPAILPGAVERRARWGYRQDAADSWVPRADPAAMRQLIEGFRTPYLDEFREVAVPMVHLRGEASRIVSEPSWASAMTERPDDRFVVVAEADHYIPEEHPELVAAEIALALGV
ncbi:alpha/beta hydrolase [Herbiconiux sp. CPCC 205716]|uniref:Alpha/beta hydrolase n=1 Tax=Herbiconiux gentiana TaxID=2970912 RepID=A0ABT2GBQ3_9MICO|nr:alpha/beta hydrolase [Herbiconiux gentiana]MCS5713573.1 alpha/beta hydrolase [Herbiconiux gentiana]